MGKKSQIFVNAHYSFEVCFGVDINRYIVIIMRHTVNIRVICSSYFEFG